MLKSVSIYFFFLLIIIITIFLCVAVNCLVCSASCVLAVQELSIHILLKWNYLTAFQCKQ